MKATVRGARGLGLLAVAVIALASGPARANGNYSHLWAAADAVRQLPDGDLKALLTAPGRLDVLRNGAMFPDGGYAAGDGYGEISHWEPFHTAYLEWIRANFQPPWSDEAARHIAFLLGMTAHGMSDQLYDGMYLQRAGHWDLDPPETEPLGGEDGATDVCFAATQGAMDQPETWAPYADLAPLYLSQGHTVTPETLELGQTLVVFAVVHASTEAADPAKVAEYRQMYPWACGHQDDPDAPGSPVTVGKAIAAYYQVVWARLNGGGGFDGPLLDTFFFGGSPWGYAADHADPASWVSFALPRGVDGGTVTDQTVRVTDESGAGHPVNLQVYYGDGSHLVNVKPLQDWAAGALYTVTVAPPLASWDGVVLGRTHAFTFSTRAAPVVDEPEAAEAVPEAAGDVPAADAGPDVPATDAGPDAVPDPGAGTDAAGDPGTPAGGGGGSCAAGGPSRRTGFPALPTILVLTALALRRRPAAGTGRSSP